MTSRGFLTPHKAARRLDVCRETVYRYVRAGFLEARRTPTGRLWIPESAIESFAEPVGDGKMHQRPTSSDTGPVEG